MDKITQFLKDISYNSKYEFLDEGKHKDELSAIANKRGIKLPAHDLAVFKCTYGFVNRQNLNGCTLPKAEVERTLNTLVGKAVDFDHMRKRVVGHWIDAKLEGDEIIAYGIFFKGNFQDDYDLIKDYWEYPRLQKFWDKFLEEEASCWKFLKESQSPFRDIKCFFNIDEDRFRINNSLWGNNIGFNDDLLDFKDNEELKLYFFKEKAIFRQNIINRRQNMLNLEMTSM
ncbi:hypothetical protein LCGC14_2489550 [marine sediment metagenome]|uniref:Uncharacterized protein n=1 Tax=marine sediment metagenome TaxID=412755 RepID=A0A0F9B589_9ZZZZ